MFEDILGKGKLRQKEAPYEHSSFFCFTCNYTVVVTKESAYVSCPKCGEDMWPLNKMVPNIDPFGATVSC